MFFLAKLVYRFRKIGYNKTVKFNQSDIMTGRDNMQVNVINIMTEFAGKIKELLGNTLDSVILYGSYARGDYSVLSDVDVMILVTLTESEIKDISDQISDLAFDYMMTYSIDISPVVENIEHFNYWVDNLPYYRNVRDEGVKLSA